MRDLAPAGSLARINHLVGLLEISHTWNVKTSRDVSRESLVAKALPALDAHVVVFIARMYDVDRRNLIPEKLQQYGEKAMSDKVWQDLMEGRNTTGPLPLSRGRESKS